MAATEESGTASASRTVEYEPPAVVAVDTVERAMILQSTEPPG